jgi:hypothetical protein
LNKISVCVFVAFICGENETPTKAKRDLNKIYTKYKEYETYKSVIEDIKTVEINGFDAINIINIVYV